MPSKTVRKKSGRTGSRQRAPSRRKWSAAVSKRSNALDTEPRVFASRDPKRIALSLKRSAERSKRRKAGAYQSAMSMLNFYTNRAGRNLPAARRKILARAKDELRRAFGRAQSR